MSRREYSIDIHFNFTRITKVIIDPHYEEKHAESINDEIILKLVQKLDGTVAIPEESKPPFSYFTEDDQIYIGVINAYRR